MLSKRQAKDIVDIGRGVLAINKALNMMAEAQSIESMLMIAVAVKLDMVQMQEIITDLILDHLKEKAASGQQTSS